MKKSKLMDTDWISNMIRGLVTGAVSAPLITMFANAIAAAGKINSEHPFITLFLPFGAVIIALIYKKLGEKTKKATVYAIDEIHLHEDEELNLAKSQNEKQRISPIMGITGFFASILSHMLGASVGKEGVGVQIGLSAGNALSRCETRLIKRSDDPEPYYLMSGASAAFGALFGSPISGVLFGIQFASPSFTRLDALMPCTIASFTSVIISNLLGIHILTIPAYSVLETNFTTIFAVILFAIAIGFFSRYFCYSLKRFSEFNRKIAKGNEILTSLIPACIVLFILLLNYFITGNTIYNGLSSNLLYSSISGNIPLYSFIIKSLLIFLSIAAGFIGGEVVPLLVTGAAFGYTAAYLTGFPASAFSALGALGMLSGGTNLPLVCFALGLELFHYTEPGMLFLTVALAYIASGNEGIYAHQRSSFR